MTPCRLVSSYRPFGCSFFNNRSWPLGSWLHCQPVTAKRSELLLYALLHIPEYFYLHYGPGSSVGIATELRSWRSGIESRWGRDLPPVQTGPGAQPFSCTMGTRSFPGVKCGQGVLLTTHPHLVPRSWKSRAIPLPTLWAKPDLQRDHFTFFICIFISGTRWHSWLRHCATSREIVDLITDGIIGIFFCDLIFRPHYNLGVDSASNKWVLGVSPRE